MTNKGAEILFALIRRALFDADRPGIEPDYATVEASVWSQVVELAGEHGVGAIVADGFDTLYEGTDEDEVVTTLDLEENETIKYELYAMQLNQETFYSSQLSSSIELSDALRDKGLEMVVLKGLALGDCYPRPEHRYSCDLDCFLVPSDGTSIGGDAFSYGNDIVRSMGIEVNEDYYKNSSFDFKDIHVENHHFCTAWRGSEAGRRFELLLEKLLPEHLSPICGGHMFAPSPLFTALLLTKHAYQHYLIEDGILIKHILDWGLFMRRHKGEIEEGDYWKYCREFGLDRFAQAMTQVAGFILGEIEIHDLSDADQYLLSCVVDRVDTVAGVDRLSLARHIIFSGRKFRYFGAESRLACLWHFVRGYYFEKKPDLNI